MAALSGDCRDQDAADSLANALGVLSKLLSIRQLAQVAKRLPAMASTGPGKIEAPAISMASGGSSGTAGRVRIDPKWRSRDIADKVCENGCEAVAKHSTAYWW